MSKEITSFYYYTCRIAVKPPVHSAFCWENEEPWCLAFRTEDAAVKAAVEWLEWLPDRYLSLSKEYEITERCVVISPDQSKVVLEYVRNVYATTSGPEKEETLMVDGVLWTRKIPGEEIRTLQGSVSGYVTVGIHEHHLQLV